MKKTLPLLLLLFVAFPAFAQFTMTGEFRPKFELRDGYKTLFNKDDRPALITAQRSRLNFNYADSRIATRFSIQDVRIWGESPSKTDASSLNVFEAWAEVFFNEAWSVRLGRQELSYDQNRILGASNWNDVGASHDLVRLKYQGNLDFQAGFAYNNDKSKNMEGNYPVNYYKTLAFVRGEKNLGKFLNASAIILTDGYQKEGSEDTVFNRWTYGGNLIFGNDSLKTKILGTVYFQNGKSPEGVPINAYFVSLGIDRRFSAKLSGLIAVDYASGDDGFAGNKSKHSFNNLYGNTHSWYGYMDYFGAIDKDTKGGGLIDIYARMTNKLSKKVSSELTWHYFSFANNVIDSVSQPGLSVKADNYLGSEIDFTLKYKPVANLEISCGYSTMLAAPSMELIKEGMHNRYQQWAWLMLTFKPEFINTNKK